MNVSTRKKNVTIYFLLSAFAVIVMISSLFIGRYQIGVSEFLEYLTSVLTKDANIPAQTEIIIVNIRLPRILAAFFVGGTLSITGAAYQGMFRNPMVSPSILGVSAGSGFGAALAILLGLNSVMLQGLSFFFGIVAVVTVYAISLATGKKHDRCLTLILAGMIVSTVFTAQLSVLKYIADPDNALPTIVYWLMGGLSDIEMSDLYFIAIASVVGLTVLSISGWKLDLLSFGDDEAKTMGIEVERLRTTVIAIATLMTATAVSISGIIGWIGLVIPHITRMLIGPKNAELLPAAFLIGGIFLLIVDGFSRTITSMEIPLGITTSLIGAPFFLFILMKTSKKN